MWKRLSSGSCTAYERARLRMRRLIILAASAMAATVVAWGLPPSAAASICSNHRVCPLPDLVVTAAGVSFTQPYAFHNRDATASFADTTKNKGDDPADQSRTGLVFEPIHAPPHETRWGEDFRKVPKLQPGKSNSDVKSITFKADIPLGAYKVYVCADVHDKISESNERNNCKWSGEYFYVIRHRWPGSVSGIAGCCSVSKLEKWHTVGPSYLKFVRYKGKGRFRYDFSGTVHYSDHGIGSTCYYNGGDVTKDFNDAPQHRSRLSTGYIRGRGAHRRHLLHDHHKRTSRLPLLRWHAPGPRVDGRPQDADGAQGCRPTQLRSDDAQGEPRLFRSRGN